MGVSLVLSLTKTIQRGGKKAAIIRVIRRGLIIYALGIIYYGGFRFVSDRELHHPDIRYLGVLQRIGICYLVTGLLFVLLKPKPLLGVLVGLLVVYWALMSFVPFPGRDANNKFAEGKNLANWIDSRFLPGYKWDGHESTDPEIKKYGQFDPEGLLSTLPAVGTCLLGVFAGLLLMNVKFQPAIKVLILFGGGAALVGLGMLWGMQFPIIKKLWTSSYVLVAGGYSAMILALFYLIIDVAKLRAWATPFVWIGLNPITLYMIDGIVNFDRFAERFVGGPVQVRLGEFGPLVVSIVAVTLALLTAWFLYRKKIFLRV